MVWCSFFGSIHSEKICFFCSSSSYSIPETEHTFFFFCDQREERERKGKGVVGYRMDFVPSLHNEIGIDIGGSLSFLLFFFLFLLICFL